MKLDPVDILEAIIEADGNCNDFANPSVCKRCPLGNKRVEGKRVNCMEYVGCQVGIDSFDDINEKYKNAANDELFTIQLEAHLDDDV
jgi:hypothetical protein